jgi:hypothetical protein
VQAHPIAIHIAHVRHETQALGQGHLAHEHLPTGILHTLQSRIERTDPLVSDLGLAQGKTPEQLDDFFRTYAAI